MSIFLRPIVTVVSRPERRRHWSSYAWSRQRRPRLQAEVRRDGVVNTRRWAVVIGDGGFRLPQGGAALDKASSLYVEAAR